jgi:hypothetical protein
MNKAILNSSRWCSAHSISKQVPAVEFTVKWITTYIERVVGLYADLNTRQAVAVMGVVSYDRA